MINDDTKWLADMNARAVEMKIDIMKVLLADLNSNYNYSGGIEALARDVNAVFDSFNPKVKQNKNSVMKTMKEHKSIKNVRENRNIYNIDVGDMPKGKSQDIIKKYMEIIGAGC